MGVRGPNDQPRIDLGSTSNVDFGKQMAALSKADATATKIATKVINKENDSPKSLSNYKFSVGDRILNKLKSFGEAISQFFKNLKPSSADKSYVIDLNNDFQEVTSPRDIALKAYSASPTVIELLAASDNISKNIQESFQTRLNQAVSQGNPKAVDTIKKEWRALIAEKNTSTVTAQNPLDKAKGEFRARIDELNQKKVRLLDNLPPAKKQEKIDLIQEFDRDFRTQMIYARNEVTAWDAKDTTKIDQAIKQLEQTLLSFESNIK